MTFTMDPMIELRSAIKATIRQQVEWSEVISGCETQNRYHVFITNSNGQNIYLFKCKEVSNWFCRNCCSSSSRQFKMKLRHVSNSGEFELGESQKNTFAEFSRPFKCTCLCLFRPKLSGFMTNTKKFVGRVEDPWTFCDPMYYVYDNLGIRKWIVTGSCCQCGVMFRDSLGQCSHSSFPIYPGDTKDFKENQMAGIIIKRFSGTLKEIMSDADNFEMIFPLSSTAEEKLMLIGTVLMIDYEYYETAGNRS